MMERLIVDDLVHWAVDYKVDGFRFDLMGHLMLRTMTRARDALQSLTLEHDGVDGARASTSTARDGTTPRWSEIASG